MVKNKWINALIFVGIGVVIGLGIGISTARSTVIRTVSTVPMPDLPEMEDIEEFEFEEGGDFYFYGQQGRFHRMPERGQNRAGRFMIERMDCPSYPAPAMPFMMRRPPGRGVLALGLVGLGIGLILMRRRSKPPAPAIEEAPPPSDKDK